MCVFSSVFGPLKGSCGAEGEEKITGADIICFCHVGLASGLTHCGPVRHGCQVDVPAHMLRHDACTYATHSRTHTRACAEMTYVLTEPDMLTHSTQKKSHTYAFSHPHRCALNSRSSLPAKRSLTPRQAWHGSARSPPGLFPGIRHKIDGRLGQKHRK